MCDKITPEQIKLYRQYFEIYDENKDGVICTRELKKVSRDLGYRLDDHQIQDIMTANDLDENGTLSFDEFLSAMPRNLVHITQDEHKMAEICRKFMEYDRDGNGVVSLDEAHEILQKELAFSHQQSVELMKRYDKNGDGQLSYEEFVRFYSKVRAKSAKIQEMFREFDKDNSGSVSVEEAKQMLARLEIPGDEIETLVAMHDTNQDGELQYDEFVAFLMHA